jgi:hypothetical protein
MGPAGGATPTLTPPGPPSRSRRAPRRPMVARGGRTVWRGGPAAGQGQPCAQIAHRQPARFGHDWPARRWALPLKPDRLAGRWQASCGGVGSRAIHRAGRGRRWPPRGIRVCFHRRPERAQTARERLGARRHNHGDAPAGGASGWPSCLSVYIVGKPFHTRSERATMS